MVKSEKERRAPFGRLEWISDERGVVLQMDLGQSGLDIRAKGVWFPVHAFPKWTHMALPLVEPLELAAFIRCLIARYNALVEDMNQGTDGLKMNSAREIEP